ncbi:MAG: hypothetical protein AAFX05_03070 [Planctomycetota bacterium]
MLFRTLRGDGARGVVALTALGGCAASVLAIPVSLDPAWTPTVFDTSGALDPGASGLFLSGLEVDPLGGTVYVLGHDVPPGGASGITALFASTGLGTAVIDNPGVPVSQVTRANDLTFNPLTSTYDFVGNAAPGGPLPGPGGIYQFTPGAAGATTYAGGAGFPTWATSGLTFGPGGVAATVTSDVGVGHHVGIPAGAVATGPAVNSDPLPLGYEGGADDHVITLDGRTIVIGDLTRKLYNVTGGAGTVFPLFDLTTIPGFVDTGFFGSRGTVDPATGDIFVAFATGGGTDIFRIKADGSAGSLFATGFVDGVRDIDFGLSSAGDGTFSLYATEVNLGLGVGSIYEFQIPAPGAAGLLAIAGGCLLRRRR